MTSALHHARVAPDPIEQLVLETWNPSLEPAAQAAMTDTLEAGRVLYLPHLRFEVEPHEQRFLSTRWSDGKSKNITLRGGQRALRGAVGAPPDLAELSALLERFARQAAGVAGGRAVSRHGGEDSSMCAPPVAG